MRPEVAEVTYVVMSDALEATVQVRLRLKDGHNTAGIGGEITARIDGFEDKYRSVLFRCAKGTRQCFSPTDDDSWFLAGEECGCSAMRQCASNRGEPPD